MLLTGCNDRTARLWSVATGKQIRIFGGHSAAVNSVEFSHDGRLLITGNSDQTAALWDMRAGKEVSRFGDSTGPDQPFSEHRAQFFSPTGTRLWSFDYGAAQLWDVASGRVLRTVGGGVLSLASVSDRGYVVVGNVGHTSRLINATTGEVMRQFAGNLDADAVALSPDHPWLLTASHDETVSLWDIHSGKEIRNFRCGKWGKITSISFSPDSTSFIVGIEDGTAQIWDPTSGKETQRLVGHFGPVNSVSFSRDGLYALTGSTDHSARLWDVANGRELQRYEDQPAVVNSVGFSPDTKFIATGGADGVTRLWDRATGKQLAALVSFSDGSWETTDGVARYDSAVPNNSLSLHWIMSDDPDHALPLEIFMRDYYEPRLLPRLLACHAAEAKDPAACERAFPKVRPLGELNRVQPAVKIVGIHRGASAEEAMVEVEALGKTDPSEPNKKTKTAAYDLRLFRDGELVGQWPEPKGSTNGPEDIEAWRQASQVPTARHSFRVTLPSGDLSKPVEFTAYAFNEDRVKSETAQADPYKLPSDTVKRKPKAYVITVGVNKYKNPRWELEFAAKDAEDMSGALRHIQDYEVVPVTLVSEVSPAGEVVDQATKENIYAVLGLLAGRSDRSGLAEIEHVGELQKATPDDLVILSFSGHGYTEKNGAFYLLASDANPDENIPASSLPSFISSEELSEWLRDVDAGQLAMIIDACHSAASVDVPGFKPGPMGDRGLGQLAYDKGMRILAASQADDIALEIENLHQGLLTYALVQEGLKSGKDGKLPAAGDNGQVTLEAWLKYGEQRTPTLYQDIRDGKIKAVGYSYNQNSKSISRDPKPNPSFLDQTQQHAQTPSLFDFHKQEKKVLLQ
jgi:WD40 repeat protein